MKEGKIKRIDELVEQALRQTGVFQKLKEHEVCRVWPDVVGRMISSRTKNLEMVNGKLFVSFTSAVVRNEIMMVREGLIEALNERVGEKVVRELVIR